jgi:PAS domain S-box-containing protein
MDKGQKKVDILVVDDRPDGLIAMEAILSDSRCNVVTALSGPEAIKLLRQFDFAAILLDVQMPGMDGFETAHYIKGTDEYHHIPIVFVTAINQDERYVYRGYETGAIDYVFKPFDPIILRSKVGVFIDLYLKERQIRATEARLLQSERNERLRQLAEFEVEALRRYRNLADAIPHMVFRARADGYLDYFNKIWSDFTGLSVEASMGDGWQSSFHSEDLPVTLKLWIGAMDSGQPFETECRIRRHDGSYRWHLMRVMPEMRLVGEVQAWIGSGTDIHDRKIAEEELRAAKDVSDVANAAKTEFLANISHEIRTPLSAIIGFSDLLLNPENCSAGERLEYAMTIRRNGEQLLRLINEILDISKIEAGKLEVELLEVDLPNLLEDIRPLFELKTDEKGLVFSIHCDTKIPRRVRTDPMRLRQILVNVVGNAIKFTDRGCVSVRLSQEPGQHLRISVADTGIGVPPEKLNRLFQPFMQVDSSTSRRYGGTGLGLALSRKLALSLDGDLKLLQSDAQGTVFELDLGCETVGDEMIEPGAIFKPRQIQPPVSTKRKAKGPQLLMGKRVLLVEDAIDNQVLISRFLRMEGAEVEISGNGEEALTLLRADDRGFDVILMDIQMPGVDGYTATAQLRSEGYVAPIIAFTAHALQSEREKCLQAGFDDHIAKPVDRGLLVSRIQAFSKNIPTAH